MDNTVGKGGVLGLVMHAAFRSSDSSDLALQTCSQSADKVQLLSKNAYQLL